MSENIIQMPKRTLHHALCDRCYPEFLTPPDELVAWCGEEIKSEDFPGPEDNVEFTEDGIPKNACPECVETFNCVTCGLAQDATDYAQEGDCDD